MSTTDPRNSAPGPVVHGHTPLTGHTGELPHNETVAFETRDVQVRSIYWYLIALTISVAASFFICIYILRYTERFVSREDTPMMPARAAMGRDYRMRSCREGAQWKSKQCIFSRNPQIHGPRRHSVHRHRNHAASPRVAQSRVQRVGLCRVVSATE